MVKRYLAAQQGYVALLAVLVMGAVSLAVSLALLQSGTDRQREIIVAQASTLARTYAMSCAEDALQQLHDNTSYTGTSTLTQTSGSCTYTVTSTSSTTYVIASTGTSGTVVRKVQVYATIGATSISITSWQEVS